MDTLFCFNPLFPFVSTMRIDLDIGVDLKETINQYQWKFQNFMI